MEPSRSGIVSATIAGWYSERRLDTAVAPEPATIERKKAASQVGHPENRPNAAPTTLLKEPPFVRLTPAPLRGAIPAEVPLESRVAMYRSEMFSPTSDETKIISKTDSGTSWSPRCCDGK